MGLLDFLLGNAPTVDIAQPIAPPFPSVDAQIAAYVAAREAGLLDPLAIPAVERGVELIASTVASMAPVVYRDGNPEAEQPRLVDRPSPWMTRHAFLTMTVRSMIECGGASWFLFDHDPESGRPRAAEVVPDSEVEVAWDEARIRRVFRWRGKTMEMGRDFLYIPLSPRAGQLRGTSPLRLASSALWTVAAAETFAAGFFSGAGVPSGTINSPVTLDKAEADALKAAWLEAHAGPVPTPAVLSGGVTYEANATSPEASQLVEAREAGVATVARILGIPAPLLLVQLGGSALTYQNVGQLMTEFVKATVGPLYLSPIEAAWGGLLSRTESVRFDLGELQRVDPEARWRVYAAAAELGVLDSQTIAGMEGFRPATQVQTPYRPVAGPGYTAPPREVPA
jgi:HK97 family phage portal protein